MTSPFKKHQIRTAQLHQKTAESKELRERVQGESFKLSLPTSAGQPGEYQVVLAAMENAKKALKDIPSIADKIDLKKKIIPEFLPFIEAYRDSGDRFSNEVLTTLVIWLLDIEDIELALDLADFAIEQHQVLPEQFKRDLPTLVTEAFFDWGETQFKAEQSAEPYLGYVLKRVESKQWPIEQIIVLNKIYKLAGLYAERAKDFACAVKYFQLCVDVNPEKHGVKKRLEFCTKNLPKQNEATK